MNRFLLVVGVGLWGLSGVVAAQSCSCSGAEQIKNTLATELTGNTFCVSNGSGGWASQEQHRAGGELWDYKRGAAGPTNVVDPTKKLGTWAVTGTGSSSSVTYTYNAFGSTAQTFKYQVCQVGTSTSFGFCPDGTGTATVMATRKAGVASGCP